MDQTVVGRNRGIPHSRDEFLVSTLIIDDNVLKHKTISSFSQKCYGSIASPARLSLLNFSGRTNHRFRLRQTKARVSLSFAGMKKMSRLSWPTCTASFSLASRPRFFYRMDRAVGRNKEIPASRYIYISITCISIT